MVMEVCLFLTNESGTHKNSVGQAAPAGAASGITSSCLHPGLHSEAYHCVHNVCVRLEEESPLNCLELRAWRQHAQCLALPTPIRLLWPRTEGEP